MTTNGVLHIKRTILRPKTKKDQQRLEEIYGKGTKSIIPIDDALGISFFPFKISIDMMLMISYLAITLNSYQKTKEILFSTLKINITAEIIRLVTNFLGKIVYEYDCINTFNTIERAGHNNEVKDYKDEILYLETDGNFICIRDEEKHSWVENKVGIAFRSSDLITYINENGEKCNKRGKCEYISYLGPIDDYKKHFYALALRWGYNFSRKVILISDGAGWIRTFRRDYLPNSLHILDFYHLMENTYAFCKSVYGIHWEKKAEEFISYFLNSEWEFVLKEIEAYKNYKFSNIKIVNLYTYILSHIESINYKYYIENGYFIGSGVIESANRYVIQSRIKGPGKSWIYDNAQMISTLRAKICSDLWNSEVKRVVFDYFQRSKK